MHIYVIHLMTKNGNKSKGTAIVVDTGYKKLERAQSVLKNIGFEMVDETNFRRLTGSGSEQNAQIVKVHFYD
ncbi:hypothetical protein [Lysinibacillus sp. OF-1]|uniref:hypothetical protein n=1 Tax=Lysinibacillus sp. OF-1 TaxID=2972483 RepID=UPI00232F06E8|nr:hypothetical protein [Lysinibacillus sp. OF-1]WCH46360.1 hypothetical protein NV349_14835 [Lysinibacillus sp. OF-1]